MATENIKYHEGVDFGLALIPTGNQPLDARTIVTSLPATASDFTGDAAYEGMIVSLLPDHKLFMLTSSLQDILAGNALVWKEVGAEQELPSLEGYATTQYVDEKFAYLNSDISAVEAKADAAQSKANDAYSLAESAYNISYTIAYTEGIENVIDTIKDIAYWINEDPAGAADLITRISSAEDDIAALETTVAYNTASIAELEEVVSGLKNYDDTEIRTLITTNSGDIDKLEEVVSGLKNYDDTEIRALIESNTSNISYNKAKIDVLEEVVSGLSNYDDTEVKNSIAYNSASIDALEETVSGLKNYDDAEIRGLIESNTSNISYNKAKIDVLEEVVSGLSNYDDAEIRGLITTNTNDISDIKETIKEIQSSGYDDTEIRALIEANTSNISYNKAKIESLDLNDASIWKENQTGDALIVDSQNKAILNITDYTSYIQTSCSLTWDKM